MNKTILYLIFLILFVNCITAYDYTININESLLLDETFGLNISSDYNNNTLFFNTNDSDMTINYNSHYFNTTNESINMSVSIYIPNVGTENLTYYLFVNQSNSNDTFNYSFFINVEEIVLPEPYWTKIDNGEYSYVVCNTVLPDTFEYDIIVAGAAGSNVSLLSSVSWLQVQDNVTIGEFEFSTVTVTGVLNNLTVGTYDENVFSIIDGVSDEMDFKIIVKDCGVYDRYEDYLAECDIYTDKDSRDYKKCLILANNKYYTDYLIQMDNLEQTTYINVTRNVTKEIPVEVFKIDNNTVDDIIAKTIVKVVEDSFKNIIDGKNEELAEAINDKNVAQSESSELLKTQQDANKIIQNHNSDVNKTAYALASQMFDKAWKKESRQSFWSIIFQFFLGVAVIIGIGFLVYERYEGRFMV